MKRHIVLKDDYIKHLWKDYKVFGIPSVFEVFFYEDMDLTYTMPIAQDIDVFGIYNILFSSIQGYSRYKKFY